MRFLLVDDHEIMRQGLALLLQRAGHEVVAEAGNGMDAIRCARKHNPDFVVMDITMPVMNGLDATLEVRRHVPKAKVIVLTVHADKTNVIKALRAGAQGYVLKLQAAKDLLAAIETTAKGEVYLSSGISVSLNDVFNSEDADALTLRERQIVQLVAEGGTTKEIAAQLNISAKTAEAHRNNVMRKLDIKNVVGLVHYAISNGLVTCSN